MKPLIIGALGALLAFTSSPAQESATCPAHDPHAIRTDQTLWKDGGSSLSSDLTIDGKRIQVLFRFDEKGRLMIAELNSLKDSKDGIVVEQQVKLPTLWGENEAPYSIFTKYSEPDRTWIKDYYNYQGRKIMIEKVDKKTSASTYHTPNNMPLSKEEVDRVFETIIAPKANWLHVSDFRQGDQSPSRAPSQSGAATEEKPATTAAP